LEKVVGIKTFERSGQCRLKALAAKWAYKANPEGVLFLKQGFRNAKYIPD